MNSHFAKFERILKRRLSKKWHFRIRSNFAKCEFNYCRRLILNDSSSAQLQKEKIKENNVFWGVWKKSVAFDVFFQLWRRPWAEIQDYSSSVNRLTLCQVWASSEMSLFQKVYISEFFHTFLTIAQCVSQAAGKIWQQGWNSVVRKSKLFSISWNFLVS